MAWALRLPGQRGVHIPEDVYDRMYAIGNGVTLPIWGRPILPHQMQWLYDRGLTQPAQIHAAFSQLPHPHAPNVSVGDYPHYANAMHVFEQHSK